MINKDVIVVTAETESGDLYVIGAFDYIPTGNELDLIGKQNYPSEYEGDSITIYYSIHRNITLYSKGNTQ